MYVYTRILGMCVYTRIRVCMVGIFCLHTRKSRIVFTHTQCTHIQVHVHSRTMYAILVCVYMRGIYVCMRVCIYAWVYACLCEYVIVCVREYMFMCESVPTRMPMYVRVYSRVYEYVYMYDVHCRCMCQLVCFRIMIHHNPLRLFEKL